MAYAKAGPDDFLSRIFDKLLFNFAWWVNLEDREGNNVFEGGFLGLDNIGPAGPLAPAGRRHPRAVRATGWMGFYTIAMGSIAMVLNRARQHRRTSSGGWARRRGSHESRSDDRAGSPRRALR